MLIDILQEMAKSSTHTYSSLAKSLHLDQEMVKQLFRDLIRMGYVVSDDPGCGDDACDECSVCCNKSKAEKAQKPSPGITRWRLTEKGKSVTNQNARDEK